MKICTFCNRHFDQTSSKIIDDGDIFCSRGCLTAARKLSTIDSDRQTDDTHDFINGNKETHEPVYFSIDGMHTQACESYLERLATEISGVVSASASYPAETIRVVYEPDQVTADTIQDGLSRWGYRASEPTPGEDPAARDAFDFDHFRTIFSVIVVGPIYMLYLGFFYPIYLGIYPISYLDNRAIVLGIYGPIALFATVAVFGVGFPIFRSAYISLRERRFTLDVLVSLTAFIAFAYSIVSLVFLDRLFLFFDVATTIIVVATIGNHARARFKRRAISDLTAFVNKNETTAHRLTATETIESIPLEDCQPGDRLLVKPGERIPLDGVVIDGTGAVNEALVTGEARPQRKAPDDTVIGGSVAVDGAFEIRVDDNATSTLDRLRDVVWNLQAVQTSVERVENYLVSVYTPIICILTGATFLAWLVLDTGPESALLTALTVLVVACPSALSLSTPLAFGKGISAAADHGLSVLDQTVLERISNISIVVFDKTGTLTTGEMRVTNVEAPNTELVLQRAAAVESRSSHPIATAITAASSPPDVDITSFERYPRGVIASVEEVPTAVGHPELFDGLEWTVPASIQTTVTAIQDRGELPTIVGWNGEAKGVIALADTPRDGWETTIEALNTDQRQIVVLTGDDPSMAQRFIDHPAIDDVFASVPPEAKETIIQHLRETGEVAMVGDGTNDAPALATADLGVAMVTGTELSLTVSDALITSDTLTPILDLFSIARRTRQRVIENVVLAFSVPVISVPLAMAGYVTPVLAALAMTAAAVLVLGNSVRSIKGHSPESVG